MIPKVKLLVWKLIRGKIPTRSILRYIETSVYSDCPYCDQYLEDIDYLSMNCYFVQEIQNTDGHCPNPTKSNLKKRIGLSMFGTLKNFTINGS